MNKAKKGFTLIELLVVIAIIGILAGLVIVRIGSASKDARNSRRKSDMAQIKTAIEQYKANGGSVRANTGTSAAPILMDATATVENGAAKIFPSADTSSKYPSGYLSGSVYPKDPQSGATIYYYRIYSTGTDYTIMRAANDAAGTTLPADAPTATEVPDVQS